MLPLAGTSRYGVTLKTLLPAQVTLDNIEILGASEAVDGERVHGTGAVAVERRRALESRARRHEAAVVALERAVARAGVLRALPRRPF